MASGPGGGKSEHVVPRDRRAHLDQVKVDGVTKELVRNQEESAKIWPTRWDFMKNPRQHWEVEAKRRGLPDDIFDRADKKRQPQQWGVTRIPTAPLQDCDAPPVLSSGVIGWRSRNSNNRLDLIAGPLFVSPMQTVDPPLGPTEPDPKQQRFIFLG